MNDYDNLKLENQICFPLYVCSKEIIKRYKPFLDEIDLTYTQYITMMALWEEKQINVVNLGKKLFLDSGTLTPLLKKLEQKKLVSRSRDKEDERIVMVALTKKGEELKEKAKSVPQRIVQCVNLNPDEAVILYKTLHSLIKNFTE